MTKILIDRAVVKQAVEALDAMMAEFRALDLPYGSKAYALAKDARLDLRTALAEQAEQDESLNFETAAEAKADRERAEAYYRQAEHLLTANERTLHAEIDRLKTRLANQQAEQPQEPSAGGVLFAVEQAIQNGDCPWQIEQAFDEYEEKRRNITKD